MAPPRRLKCRSARACLSCRGRKVRCDVQLRGSPCNNCRLDGVECVLVESNRGRRNIVASGSRIVQKSPAETPSVADEVLRDAASTVGHHSTCEPQQQEQHMSPGDEESRDYLVSLSFDDGHAPDKSPDQGRRRHSTQASSTLVDGDENLDTRSNLLPAYIQSPPRHITATDMAYLSAKDALTVPDNEFRDALLGIYADVVYPTMPCTNLPGFLDSISSNNSSKPISLLLFQSVMFSSVGFAPIDLLHRHGFQNGRAAREVFFRRVRLLYGLDYETDRLTLIQSLLLMTYWFGGPADVKDTWHWSGIAISLAQECGFHRDPSHLSISDADKRLRRRVWWSCYMRDRLIALGIRRPARLADDEASVPMLTLDDFDHIGPGASPDVAATCVDLASLCVLIGRILHSQYSGLPTHPGGDLTKFAVLPRPWHAREKHVAQLDCALEEWLQIRDPRSIYTPGNASSQRGYLHLHQIQLQIIYLTAVGALHRPQVFCSAPAPAAPGRRESRQKLRQAAGALNKLAFDLRSAGLMGYLFTSSVPAFLSAAIVHLLDVQSADEQTGSLSLGRFYHCVQVLQDLRAIYVSADAAVAFLETVLRMVDVNVPMLANKSAAIAPSDGDIEGDGRAYATPLASENRGTNEEMQTGIKEGGQLQDNVDRDFTAHPAGSASEMFLVDSWNGVEGLLPALVNDNSLGVDWDLSQFWNSPEYGGQAV